MSQDQVRVIGRIITENIKKLSDINFLKIGKDSLIGKVNIHFIIFTIRYYKK